MEFLERFAIFCSEHWGFSVVFVLLLVWLVQMATDIVSVLLAVVARKAEK